MRQLKIVKQITNRETASLDKYLQEIGKEPLISAEEEVKLAQKIKQGDPSALEKMVKSNLRFVVSVSKQYQNQGLSLPDLINEGNLGLIKAARRFDETRGFKFISYAVWWIRQSILQALAEHARLVRLPLNKIGVLNKINRTFSNLEQNFEREPTPDEISEELHISIQDVEKSIKSNLRHVSMDAPIPGADDEDRNMYDVLSQNQNEDPSHNLIKESLRNEIQRSLSTLSSREKDILNCYYGLNGKQPLTLEEIAEIFGLTRERVRQLREKGIRRLKNTSRSKILRTYLG